MIIREGQFWFVIVSLYMFLWRIRFVSTFHLYRTRHQDLNNDNVPNYHDCIYTHQQQDDRTQILIPYCRRDFIKEKHSTRILDCGRYRKLTFQRLQQARVTVADLYAWYAPLDIQNDYVKYLNQDGEESNQEFCNCTQPYFGIQCEYQIGSRNTLFMSLVESQFNAAFEKSDIQITCYKSLKCVIDGNCFDWRQVCNGIRDCKSGEDEQHCIEMETSECDTDKEYRCRNGMCISRSFFVDFVFDCLDESDEKPASNPMNTICPGRLLVECEERMSAWLKTSCGDGQSVDSSLDMCTNKRPIVYHQKFTDFYMKFNRTNCSAIVFCATNERTLLMIANLSTDLCVKLFGKSPNYNILINAACPRLFEFPHGSIFQPAVRLIIDTNIHKSQFSSDYVCYDSKYICPLHPPTFMLQKKDNVTLFCRNVTDYYSISPSTGYSALFMKLQKVLSYCTSNCPNNISHLFRCDSSYQCLSHSRRFDGHFDCVSDKKEDEQMLTICPSSISDRVLCNTQSFGLTQCLPRIDIFSSRFKSACLAQTPEIAPLVCQAPNDLGCRFIRGTPLPRHLYRFQELCNGRIYADWTEQNATDETSCSERQYECHSRYGECNRMWDCFNGQDELNCPAHLSINPTCEGHSHYCYDIEKPYRRYCLPGTRAGDGVIDCLGASDERLSYCPLLYPSETDRRFKCLNSSYCVSVYDVCDGRKDCPLGDDEWPCPRRIDSHCPNDTFALNDGKTCIVDSTRCDNLDVASKSSGDEIFCDLIGQRRFVRTTVHDYTAYPPRADRISTRDIKETITAETETRISQITSNSCRRGYLSASGQCLCPPSYYGDTCQFQSDRLTIVLQIDPHPDVYDLRAAVFVFIIRIDHTNQYEQVMHFHQLQATLKHIVYLLSPTDKRSVSIRIDAWLLRPISVSFQMAWIFDVPFSFLPVNRLALKLIVDGSHTSSACSITCVHGQCISYVNAPTRHYCQCDDSWTGFECNSSSRMHCAKGAKETQGICVCPLGRYGDECYVKLDVCYRHKCLNNGQCVPFDLRVAPSYVCQCSENYFGTFCQHRAATVLLRMPLRQKYEERDHIPLVLVHLLDIDSEIGLMTIQDRYIFSNVKFGTNLSIVYPWHTSLPQFVFAQLFSSMDTSRGAFHLVSLSPTNRIAITTSVLVSNYCPAIDEILGIDIMQKPYITRLQYYHRSCLVLGTRCFHDEQYLCLCDNIGRFDCFLFDHNDSNCSDQQLCQNDAYCLYARKKRPPLDFGCVCPKCFYGSLCQFTTAQYTIALDVLIDRTVPFAVIVALAIMFLGFVLNFCAICVFIKQKAREVGCGIYLLSLGVTAQISLMIFATKFIILLRGTHSLLSCIIVEYLLDIFPSIFDWLTACVAAERMVTVMRGASFNKTQSIRIAKWIVPNIALIILVLSLHEVFSRQLLSDPRASGRTWCIMKLPYSWLKNYEIALNIIHLIGPFLVNLLTTIMLIRKLSKRKSSSSMNSHQINYWIILTKQLYIHRPFIISPMILLILGLPRLMFTFAFACITKPWQKQVYLISYVIACLPYVMVVLIYVWPSKIYKQELKTTFSYASKRIRSLIARKQ